MLSLVMSVYNKTPAQLKAAIDSMLQQTVPLDQLVIVLDNPEREDLKEILEAYAQTSPKFKLIFNEANLGVSKSVNRAVQSATGDYLVRMDADDVALPQRVELELAALKARDLDMISANINYINEAGEITGAKSKIPTQLKTIAKILPLGSTIVQSTVIIKKAVFLELGGYRVLPTAEDYDLWLRLVDAGYQIGSINDRVVNYRLRRNSLTSNAWKTFIVTKYVQQLQRERQTKKTDSLTHTGELNEQVQTQLADEQAKQRFNAGQKHFTLAMTALKQRKALRGGQHLIQCWLSSKANRLFLKDYLRLRVRFATLNER